MVELVVRFTKIKAIPTPAVAYVSLSEPTKIILIVSIMKSINWLQMAGNTTFHSRLFN